MERPTIGGRCRRAVGAVVTVACLTVGTVAVTSQPAGALTHSECTSGWSTYQPSWWSPEITNVGSVNAGSFPYMSTWTTTFGHLLNLSYLSCVESVYSLSAVGGSHYGMWQLLQSHITTYVGGGSTAAFNCYMNGCLYFGPAYYQDYAGMRYISDRYGTPGDAWNFHLANNWY